MRLRQYGESDKIRQHTKEQAKFTPHSLGSKLHRLFSIFEAH